jgi:hypothetical protein
MASLLNVSNGNPTVRYLVPFLVFLVFSWLQSFARGPAIFWFYGAKTALSFLVFAYFFRGHWREIEGRFDGRAVWVGLLVLAVWIVSAKLFHAKHEPLFDPTGLDPGPTMILAVLIRIVGASTVIPLIEEVVWRSFLMRSLIKADFLSVPVGAYTAFSFWITALTFALAHPAGQWAAAGFAGMAYGLYLVKTKNLRGCILAHAVTNFGSGVYIVVTRDWDLWV